MHLPRLLVSALVAFAVVAACGGPTPATTNPPTITQPPAGATPTPGSNPTPAAVTTPAPVGNADVCSLLSPADLTAALGETYVAGTLDPVGQCLWNVEGALGNTGSLVVGAIQPQQLSFIKSAFFQGGVDVTVAGHAAFYNPTVGLGSLWVDLGNGNLFVLSFPQSDDLDPSYQAIAIQLAETALGNM